MNKSLLFKISAPFAISLLTACATTQTTAVFSISTTPAGAAVTTTLPAKNPDGKVLDTVSIRVSGEQKAEHIEIFRDENFLSCPATPCAWEIPRTSNFAVLVEKEGYAPQAFKVRNIPNKREVAKDGAPVIAGTGAAVTGMTIGVSQFLAALGGTAATGGLAAPLFFGGMAIAAVGGANAFNNKSKGNHNIFVPQSLNVEINKSKSRPPNNTIDLSQYFRDRRHALTESTDPRAFNANFPSNCPWTNTKGVKNLVCLAIVPPLDTNQLNWQATTISESDLFSRVGLKRIQNNRKNRGIGSGEIVFINNVKGPTPFISCINKDLRSGIALTEFNLQDGQVLTLKEKTKTKLFLDAKASSSYSWFLDTDKNVLIPKEEYQKKISLALINSILNEQNITFQVKNQTLVLATPKLNDIFDTFLSNCGLSYE